MRPLTACGTEVVGNADDCDDADPTRTVRRVAWWDEDADGWGGAVTPPSCGVPPGAVDRPGDCDDSDGAVHPGATEVCSGRDEDCDGRIDDADAPVRGTRVWFGDEDGDGHGSPSHRTRACDPPLGHVADADDCDDADPARSPSAMERCLDGTDDDCDGVVDEACPQLLDSADVQVQGSMGWDQLGASIAVGDWDGDGQDDVMVGAPGSDAAGEGAGAVHHLTVEELRASGRVDRLGGSRLTGAPLDVAGFSVGPPADLDGDGVDDLLVSLLGGGVGLPGAVSVVLGPITGGGALPDREHARLTGTDDYDGLGAFGVAVGAVMGDEHADVLVGILGDDTGAAGGGAAVLLRGPMVGELDAESATMTFRGGVEGGALGTAVLLVDLDGDGVDDVVLGEPGAARVVAWTGLWQTTGEAVWSADAAPIQREDRDSASELGAQLVAGDLNGDGHPDLVVGAPGGSDPYRGSGRWDVLAGPLSGQAPAELDRVARLVDTSGLQTRAGDAGADATVQDLDSDGQDDLLLGSPGHWTSEVGSGGVFWFTGPLTGTHTLETADRQVLGTVVEEAAGDGLGVGDIDGDGLLDLLVGAPMDEDDYGRVGVFWGARAAW